MDKIEELKEKVDRDPTSKLFVPLAEEYRKAGRLDEAIDVLTNGLELQPNYTSAIVALGKIYFEKEMYPKAKAELENVVKAVPDHLFAQRKLADIYRVMGDREKALEQYRRVIKLNPLDEEAQSILEGLSQEPAMPEAPEELEELVPEGEDFTLSLGADEELEEEFAEDDALAPLEEIETEAEFLEAFVTEAAPVDEILEELEEVGPEEDASETLESDTPIEELIEAAEEAAEIIEEVQTTTSDKDIEEGEAVEAVGEVKIEPGEEIAEQGEAIEAVEEMVAESTEEGVVEMEAIEEVEEVEAAPVEQAVDEAEAQEALEEAEAVEEVEASPQGEDVFEEAGFQDLASVGAEETGTEVHLAQEYISKGEYAKAINLYKDMLKSDPENMVAKQGLQELESLVKLIGSEKEVIIAGLEAFLDAIKKRKNELYRNA